MTTATVPDVVSPETNQLHLLSPARIADTANGTGTCDGSPCVALDANDSVEVTVAGVGGIPASGSVVVTGTITAIAPDGDGSISVNPNGPAAAGAVIALDGETTTAAFTAQLVDGELVIEADVDTDMAIDITGYFMAPNPFALASNYWSVAPEVVVETGNGTGTCDGNPCTTLATGETEIDVTGFTGYPTGGATAVTVSILASTSGAAGTLRVNPNGAAAAGEITWDSSFAAGTGQFTVPVSGTGTITLEASTATDVTVSVNGYWKVPSSIEDLGTGLTPLEGGAARLVDTRNGTGNCNNSPCDTIVGLAAPMEIPTAGQAGIPAEVTAVMASVTTHNPAGAGLVGLASTSSGGGVAIAHSAAGTSATVIVPVNPDTGAIYLGAWNTTDVTIDISSYFTRPTTTYEYEYGTGGIRTAKHRTGGYATTTEYTWTSTGGLPLLLAQHTGSDTTNIIYGPGGTPIYQTNNAGDLLYYHQDHQGSTRLVTNSNGTTKGAITYNAYGKQTATTIGWLQQQPLLTYTGQYVDNETGYIYLRARYYDPAAGQFTTSDPAFSITGEPYSYASSNPLNAGDPLGLWPSWDDVKGAAGDVWDGTGGKVVSGAANLVEDPVGFVKRNRHALIDAATAAGAVTFCVSVVMCGAVIAVSFNAHAWSDVAVRDGRNLSAGEALYRSVASTVSGGIGGRLFSQGTTMAAVGLPNTLSRVPGFLTSKFGFRLDAAVVGGYLGALQWGFNEMLFGGSGEEC